MGQCQKGMEWVEYNRERQQNTDICEASYHNAEIDFTLYIGILIKEKCVRVRQLLTCIQKC